jgi:hypothetical protein
MSSTYKDKSKISFDVGEKVNSLRKVLYKRGFRVKVR